MSLNGKSWFSCKVFLRMKRGNKSYKYIVTIIQIKRFNHRNKRQTKQAISFFSMSRGLKCFNHQPQSSIYFFIYILLPKCNNERKGKKRKEKHELSVLFLQERVLAVRSILPHVKERAGRYLECSAMVGVVSSIGEM